MVVNACNCMLLAIELVIGGCSRGDLPEDSAIAVITTPVIECHHQGNTYCVACRVCVLVFLVYTIASHYHPCAEKLKVQFILKNCFEQ